MRARCGAAPELMPATTLKKPGESSETAPNCKSSRRAMRWAAGSFIFCETAAFREARGFSEARTSLEQQWSGGGEASTEDLRLTLQRYRSFFERMLAA